MKVFKIKSDAEFYAKDLDDAFEILSRYLLSLSTDEPLESIFIGGKVEIKEVSTGSSRLNKG